MLWSRAASNEQAMALFDFANMYIVDDKALGDGTYGTVYSATSLKTSQRVAIKVVSAIVSGPSVAVERDAMSKIYRKFHGSKPHEVPLIVPCTEHPVGIPAAYDMRKFLTDGGDFPMPRFWIYVMPLAPCNLAEYIDRHGASMLLSDVTHIVRQVGQGLHYFHSETGYVHRDLKLINVLIMREERPIAVALCDYGYADRGSHSLGLSELIAQPHMGPELFDVNRTVDASFDVYSLGHLISTMCQKLQQAATWVALRRLGKELCDVAPSRRPPLRDVYLRIATAEEDDSSC
jgi:serine/threonine protein kinase